MEAEYIPGATTAHHSPGYRQGHVDARVGEEKERPGHDTGQDEQWADDRLALDRAVYVRSPLSSVEPAVVVRVPRPCAGSFDPSYWSAAGAMLCPERPRASR